MKARLFLTISLALNVTLATAVFLRRDHVAPTATIAKTQPLPAPFALQTNVETPEPKTFSNTNTFPPFHWGDIASEDLKIYRDNLHAVGCPELTIHEILKAEINTRYAARRRVILDSIENRFWGILARGELMRRQRTPQTDWGRDLEAVATERVKVLNEVLGSGNTAGEIAHQNDLQQRYSWLPAEKREKLLELEAQYETRLSEASELSSSDEQNAFSESAKNEFENTKKQLLTSEELNELRIRDSDAANWAANLSGFEPTPDEWRGVAKLKAGFEDSMNALSNANLADEDRASKQKDLEAQLAQNLKTTLGDERFSEYQLADDGRYEAARNVVERFGLSDQVAAQIYQLQRDAEKAAANLDANLSRDARQPVLTAIRQETERSLKGALGENAFSAYREYAGEWLEELGLKK